MKDELQLEPVDLYRRRNHDIDITQASRTAVVQEGVGIAIEAVEGCERGHDLSLSAVGTQNFISHLDQSDLLEIETR